MLRDKKLCSISELNYALSIVCDRWTMLILRELRLGVQHFEEIQAQTSMSSHLLRNRLRQMEADGLIQRRLYHEHPPRYAYEGTAMGKDLDMILLYLRNWGMRWRPPRENDEPATTLVYRPTNETIDSTWLMPRGLGAFSFDDVDTRLSNAFHRERTLRATTFLLCKRMPKRPRKTKIISIQDVQK